METDTRQARRGLIVFLGLVVLGTAPFQVYIISSGLPYEQISWLPPIIMWVPGIAALITRLALREGFKDVSFRLGGMDGLKAIGVALLFPVLVCGIAYGIAWATGLATLADARGGIFAGITDPITNPLLRLVARQGLALIPASLIGLVTAMGEELGWRGYMLSRLVAAKVPLPLVVSGLIWTLWHIAVILSGQYPDMGPNRLISAFNVGVTFVSISILWGTLRLKTGSFWPAALGHSSWNNATALFTSFSLGGAGLWLSESGFLVAAVTLALSLLLSRAWQAAGDRRQGAGGRRAGVLQP
jgi:uncharacterized protein